MALVNPQIAMSYRPTVEYQPRNALAEAAQIQQLVGGQRQAEVADMQLQRMRQEDAEIERIYQIARQQGGPETRLRMGQELFASRNPQQRELGYKILQHEEAKAAFEKAEQRYGYSPTGAAPTGAVVPAATQGTNAMVAPAAAPEGELVAAPIGRIPSPVTTPAAANAPAPAGETNLAYLQRQFGTPGAAPTPAAPASINTLAPAAAPGTNAMAAPSGKTLDQLQREYMTYSSLVKQGAPGAEGRLEIIKQQMEDARKAYEVKGRLVTRGGQVLYEAPAEPTNLAVLEREIATLTQQGVPANDPRIVARQSAIAQAAGQTDPLIKQYEFAQRQGFKGSMFDYKRQLAQAGRSITPPPPAAPVAVIDPATGNTIYVSREEALKNRMTPSGQGVNLTPKQIQAFEVKYPQATAAVKTFESKSDRLAADLETLANHPGLSGISGLIYGRTPALTAEARQAEALYDSIIARGGFQELQDMRAASPTGGALGPVSNTENQYLRDAFAPIKRTQDTPDLKQALLGAAQATKDSRQRVREAYDLTYEYRARRGDGAPAPATPATPATPAAPKVGAVQQGYRFKGGDPADQKNWEKQ
jgi:hypothetical protein